MGDSGRVKEYLQLTGPAEAGVPYRMTTEAYAGQATAKNIANANGAERRLQFLFLNSNKRQ
jgi:hypothetical protein